MAPSNDQFWHQFDELDRQRRSSYRRHEEAFRRLSTAAAEPLDMRAGDAWHQFCESANDLERCVAELESLTWRLGNGS